MYIHIENFNSFLFIAVHPNFLLGQFIVNIYGILEEIIVEVLVARF